MPQSEKHCGFCRVHAARGALTACCEAWAVCGMVRLLTGPETLGGLTGNGRNSWFIRRTFYALTAKTPIPSILSTLLTARKVAINGPAVSCGGRYLSHVFCPPLLYWVNRHRGLYNKRNRTCITGWLPREAKSPHQVAKRADMPIQAVRHHQGDGVRCRQGCARVRSHSRLRPAAASIGSLS